MAEQPSRAGDARYRLLVEQASDLVLEVESDGTVAYASPRLETMLGLDPQRVVGTQLCELVHEADRSLVQEHLKTDRARFRFRHRAADRGFHWLEATSARFAAGAGREHCVLVCRDAAEQHETERALRESAALFDNTFRASPNANSITDLATGRILDVNRGFEGFFGYSREEAVGATTLGLGIWPDPDARQLFVAALQEHGAVRAFETSLCLRSQERRTCLVSAETLEIDGRRCLVGVVEDITERRGAEKALRESEQKFQTAFRTSPHALSISDFETGELIEVNEAYERASGYTREQLIGQTAVGLGLITAEQRDQTRHRRAKTGVRDVELPFTNARGERRIGLASAGLIHVGGRLCTILGLLDVTEQRRVEDAKALLEEQLRQVQKLEAIGTLAGGIAHDFNNILGAMLGYTEMAKLEAAHVPEALESLAEVLHAGQRAKELVRQILTFSRRHPPERRPVRLQSVVDEGLRLLRSTLPSTIALSVEVSPDAERVDADPTQMHQVLLNLATNAAHAMQGRAGAIVIRLGNHEEKPNATGSNRIPNLRAGSYVELVVSDDGCGMDDATLARIFEPFFTTKTPGDGTGLGLSVVHGIVTEHDGIIHVASTPGAGTSFHVLLPAFTGTIEADASVEETVTRGSGERILFIDDERMLCSAAEKLLGSLGYVVTTRTNALDALTLFRADPTAFDLVITDLTMPGLTGVDVAAQVLLARPGMPLILATGFNANWTLDALRKLGIHDLVMKPLSLAELSARVHAALTNAVSGDERRSP